MRYFLQAIEKSTGIPFEQEVVDETDYQRLKASLVADYSEFYMDARWSDLDEMYQMLDVSDVATGELNTLAAAQEVCDRVGLTDLRLTDGEWIAYSPQKKANVRVTQVYINLIAFNDVNKALYLSS